MTGNVYKKQKGYFYKQKLVPYFFLAPGIIIAVSLIIVPFILSFYFSFTNYSIINIDTYKWIGLRNFVDIFTGPYKSDFWAALQWSITFGICATGLNVAFGFIIALFLNKPDLKCKPLFGTLLVIPWGVPTTIMMMVMQGIFLPSADYGVINRVIARLGINPVAWSYTWLDGDITATRIQVLLISTWVLYASMMLYVLGAMKSIEQSYYEAASIDGANSLQRLRHITIPFVYKIIFPIIIVDFGINFNNFDVIYLVTEGRPLFGGSTVIGGTDNLATLIYKVAFENKYLFGQGAAYAVLSFVIVAAIITVYYKAAGVKID